MVRRIAPRERPDVDATVIDTEEAGKSLFVSHDGEPVALRPGRRTFVSRDDIVSLTTTVVPGDADRFRDDLDQVIDQGL